MKSAAVAAHAAQENNMDALIAIKKRRRDLRWKSKLKKTKQNKLSSMTHLLKKCFHASFQLSVHRRR